MSSQPQQIAAAMIHGDRNIFKSADGPFQEPPNSQKIMTTRVLKHRHNDYLLASRDTMGTVQDHSDLVDLASTTVLPAIVESPPSRTPSPSSSNTTIESRGRGSLVAGIDAARLRTALSTASTVTSQRRDAPISTTLRSSRGGESYDSYEESASQISDPSTSDDIGSHASGEVLMEMKRHWETLSTQRLEIRRLLDDLRRARTHMRALAQAKDDADRKLELALRSDHFNTDRDTLEPYLIAIRTSKLKYQAAETTVDQLIDNVDDAIFEADIIEGRFYNRLSRRNLEADIPGPVNESQGKHQVPSRMSLRGISPDRSEDLHPSYERLREVYGDLQLAKEYCSNLGYKHTVVQSEDHDLLGPDELEFLDDFEDSLAKAKSDVQKWSQKFEELRAECAAKNLIPKSSPFFEDGRDGDYHEPHVFVPDDISLDDCLVDESTLSHSQYSLLVTNPKHVLNNPLPLTSQGALEQALMLPLNTSGRNQAIQEAMHEHSIATLLHDAIPEDKTDYINRWLLQKLRISPMEVQVLSLTFRKILKILDYNRWQRDVLSFWPRDIDRQPVQGDITITTHIRHEFETLSNPSDKREESRSQARSQAASEPLLRPADIYDDWEYLNNLRDDGQSEGAL